MTLDEALRIAPLAESHAMLGEMRDAVTNGSVLQIGTGLDTAISVHTVVTAHAVIDDLRSTIAAKLAELGVTL